MRRRCGRWLRKFLSVGFQVGAQLVLHLGQSFQRLLQRLDGLSVVLIFEVVLVELAVVLHFGRLLRLSASPLLWLIELPGHAQLEASELLLGHGSLSRDPGQQGFG